MATQRKHILLVALTLSLLQLGCGKARVATPSQSIDGPPLWEIAKTASYKAKRAQAKQEKAKFALEGIEAAKGCIEETPKNAACYYYKAINTGLYYKAHVAGYQKGLMEMVADLNMSIDIDDSYDYAGAYRTLAEVYTKAPRTAHSTEHISRNLDLAEEYLIKAVEIAPDYPENYLDLTKVQMERNNRSQALETLLKADQLVPYWKAQSDYTKWVQRRDDLTYQLRRE
jgi:tetratricopeptide (TPR) repeat protein